MQKVLVGVLVAVGLLGIRCSEDPARSEEEVPKAPAMITVNGPLSPNAPPQIAQKALEVNGYFNFVATTLTGIGGMEPAINGNIYTWQVPIGSGTVVQKIKAVRRSDGSIDWTVMLDGRAADSTVYIDRTLFIGKSASSLQSWTFFDLLSGNTSHKIAWSRDKSGTVQLEDTFAQTGELWQMGNSANGSGSYSYKVAGTLKFSATWRSDGAGSYRDYTLPGSPETNWN